jgi:phage terminase large subunit
MSEGYTDIARMIADSGDPFSIAVAHYSRTPNAFAREVLGLPPDPWQAEASRALANGHRRVSIRSGHGVGKGHWLATTICWFCCTRAPFKVGVTAPSAPQLHDALMADVRKTFNHLPPAWRELFDINLDRISLKASPDDCFVTARTSRPDNPESLQGIHSENLLLVVDEASGVPEAVYAAAQGSMSTPGAITLLAGNPTRSTGHFWRTHNLERDRWWTKRVPCHESPRVDRGFIEEIAERHGIDSNEYRIRVLGEFPLAEDDTLIPAELVDGAMARDVGLDWITHPEIWGVDVARFGSADSVLIKRRGPKVLEPPRRWNGIDTMALAGRIKGEFDWCPPANRPQLIVVDVIGIGAGVVDRLTEQSLPILGVNVGEQPSVAGRYHRLRDELWVRCREWLESRAAQLPYDDKLRADLCAPRVSYLSDGKLVVESKAQLRARGIASPDSADALIQTFASAGMALQFGLGGILNSRVPVRQPMASME